MLVQKQFNFSFFSLYNYVKRKWICTIFTHNIYLLNFLNTMRLILFQIQIQPKIPNVFPLASWNFCEIFHVVHHVEIHNGPTVEYYTQFFSKYCRNWLKTVYKLENKEKVNEFSERRAIEVIVKFWWHFSHYSSYHNIFSSCSWPTINSKHAFNLKFPRSYFEDH